MKITCQIDSDYKSLKSYFEKKFALFEETRQEERERKPEVFNRLNDLSHANFHGFSHLIKPDMLINIYSFANFWLPKICNFRQSQINYRQGYQDKEDKNNALHKYYKYLKEDLDIDLFDQKTNYDKLQSLRKVRNYFIHNGGHVTGHKEIKKLRHIDGVKITMGTLIVIEDKFIWDCLESAHKFLMAAASNCIK